MTGKPEALALFIAQYTLTGTAVRSSHVDELYEPNTVCYEAKVRNTPARRNKIIRVYTGPYFLMANEHMRLETLLELYAEDARRYNGERNFKAWAQENSDVIHELGADVARLFYRRALKAHRDLVHLVGKEGLRDLYNAIEGTYDAGQR